MFSVPRYFHQWLSNDPIHGERSEELLFLNCPLPRRKVNGAYGRMRIAVDQRRLRALARDRRHALGEKRDELQGDNGHNRQDSASGGASG